MNGHQGTLFPSQPQNRYSCPSHPGRQCRYVPLDPDPYQEGLSPMERLRRHGLAPEERKKDGQAD